MGRLGDSVSKRVADLNERLATTTKKLDDLSREILSTSETSSTYWNSINVRTRSLYEDLRSITAEWANYNLPIVYRDQIRLQIAKLKASRFDTQAEVDYRSFISSNMAKQSLASLLGEINATWYTGYQQGETTLIRLSRLTQQYLVREKELEKAVAKGYIEGGPGKTVERLVGRGSLYGVQRSIYTALKEKIGSGKYITIINKNGDAERWGVKEYATLVARTKLIEASTQGVINSTSAMGEDLVQWSAHNTTCPICSEYEGRIFSLSGRDPDFPAVEMLPPAHPHCEHSISTVIKEGLVADGTLEKYSDFSYGRTEEHPTRKSWIPISERDIA